MKKVLLFAVLLTGALAFNSCGSKDCECDLGNGETVTYDEDELNTLGFEGDFEEACKSSPDCKVV